MESLAAYLPADRHHALARGEELPERSVGAALFADISGFTPLTEALVRALGPQRGAEELPRRLNEIYDALIAEVDRYGGAVLSFSGDAITCWFDGSGGASVAPRAAACALAIQRAMGQFAAIRIPGVGVVSMAIKVAVAVGPARRFIVGDPQIQLVDALAGETIARLATAEHLAERGDVVIDVACADALGAGAAIREWRDDEESGQRFAVLDGLADEVAEQPWPPLDGAALSDEQIRPWMLAPVYTRLQGGMGEFLTELRPAVALFLRFGGIDYDADELAGVKLNAYIAWAMGVVDRYGGFLLQLTIGDKGSYLYAAFGAPLSYEDNAARALSAALELVSAPPELAYIGAVQIGISQGGMRTGAYGGVTRRTYGVLGDDVNMAARLMQAAPPGQIYVSAAARRATADSFLWWSLPPLRVKGKEQPVAVLRLLDVQERQTIRLQEPKYALPMVGREAELGQIQALLDIALAGRGQMVGVTAEAGMGKSRLVSELIRLARRSQMVGYGGECQSYGTNASYLAWQSIWRAFFNLAPGMDAEAQTQALTAELAQIDPELLPRLPLLGAVLNLSIPDTDLTRSFDAKLRKASLESLLVDCLRARSAEVPILLVLEDCHWIDALSHDLLEVLGRAIADMPVLIALAYRPPQLPRLLALRVVGLPNFSELRLTSLPAAEIAQLAQAKLGQIYGAGAALAPELVEQIAARAQGNPFYIEELLNYLHDRGIDPQHPAALEQGSLPTSLHSLILSRIDQLSESQKTLLKVASVIGRLFRAAMLWGVYNQFGDQQRVRSELEALSALELTPLDTPDPELAYLFKHILTQEVAYETLPYATRAMLHDQIGRYIEAAYADSVGQYIDLLAYHYDRSENLEKRRLYLVLAGDAAQAAYANAAAIDYFRRALAVLDPPAQAPVLLRLGQVLELVGEWQAAEEADRRAIELAEGLGDAAGLAQAQGALGWLLRKRGDYAEALDWMARAQASFVALGDLAGLSHVLSNIGEVYRLQARYVEARAYYGESLSLADSLPDAAARRAARAHALRGLGTVATWQGDYAEARALNEESLGARRELGDKPGVAVLLNNLGIIARFQGELAYARRMNDESLALFRELGDRWSVGTLLNNQACVASDQAEYGAARALLAESLSIRRQLGDRAGLAFSLNTLADVVIDEGDFGAARPLLDESLAINRELGDQTAIAYLLEDYGGVAAAEGRSELAMQLGGFAAALRERLGAPLPPAEQARVDRMLAPARQALGDAAQPPWEAGRALELEAAIALAGGGA